MVPGCFKNLIILIFVLLYQLSSLERINSEQTNKMSSLEKNLTKNSCNDNIFSTNSIQAFTLNITPQDLLTLKLCLGTPQQFFNLLFDTTSYPLWIPSSTSTGCRQCNQFNQTASLSFEEFNQTAKFTHNTWSAKGFEASDLIYFNENSQKLNWMLANEILFNLEGADGIIGFAREYNQILSSDDNSYFNVSDRFSLIDSLYHSQIIQKRVFSVNYTDLEFNQAILYIGDYTTDFTSRNKFSYCNVFISDPFFSNHSLKNYWTCQLSYLIIGETNLNNLNSNSHVVNKRALFDSSSSYIQAPFDSLNVIQKIFKNFTECSSDYDITDVILIFYCEENFDSTNIPNFSFVFNGYAYTISSKRLFKEIIINGKKRLKFLVVFNKKLDYWVLGQYFMRNFHILFDKDKGIIGFNSNDAEGSITNMTSLTDDSDFYISGNVFAVILCYFWVLASCVVIYFICLNRFVQKVENVSVSGDNFRAELKSEGLEETRINY